MPKVYSPLTEKQLMQYSALRLKEKLTEKQAETLANFELRLSPESEPPLSSGAMQYLRTFYLSQKYHCKNLPASIGVRPSQIKKGVECEPISEQMVREKFVLSFIKPGKVKRNKYVAGICDLVSPDGKILVDVKTSWSINTFMYNLHHELPKSYWLQMQAYLELYNAEKGFVCYTLIDPPDAVQSKLFDEFKSKMALHEINELDLQAEFESLMSVYSIKNVPATKRLITFEVKRDKSAYNFIKGRVIAAREYLSEIDRMHYGQFAFQTKKEDYIN